jgi:hypothetical protein
MNIHHMIPGVCILSAVVIAAVGYLWNVYENTPVVYYSVETRECVAIMTKGKITPCGDDLPKRHFIDYGNPMK